MPLPLSFGWTLIDAREGNLTHSAPTELVAQLTETPLLIPRQDWIICPTLSTRLRGTNLKLPLFCCTSHRSLANTHTFLKQCLTPFSSEFL